MEKRAINQVKYINLSSYDPSRIWFIADTHFDHTNIIKYCNRPFQTTEDMNDLILQSWNSNIQVSDFVFFVGDMAYGRNSRSPRWWLSQLCGKIIYLKGSHDDGIRPSSEGLANTLFVSDIAVLQADKLQLCIVHDPLNTPESWQNWTVHGHIHNEQPCWDFKNKRINVSVEAINYLPLSLAQITQTIEKQLL